MVASRSWKASSASPETLIYGVNPAAAIVALKDRASRWRRGDRGPDGRRLGLVIEGGGMRAVCSGGGAVALSQLGFTELFDDVYATSAAVMNASYFLSDQAALGITVYYESLVTGRFMNPLRFWRILDVDYVVDSIVAVQKPLKVDRVLASRTRFFVSLIDKLSGEGTVIDVKTTSAPLLQVFRAAMAIPVFYNRTVNLEGRQFIDGGLANPFPIEHALANGSTDLLVLLTRPASYQSKAPNWFDRCVFDLICARGNEGLRRTFLRQRERSKVVRDLAFGRAPTPRGVNIATVCTDEAETVGRTTTDPVALRQGALRYGSKILRVFGAAHQIWDLPALK